MESFDFQPRTRVIFGTGAIERVGKVAHELGFRRTLLVADRGLLTSGHVDEALSPLRQAGVEVFGFHDFEVNPDTRMIETGRAFAEPLKIDSIIGLGGGSSLDCAKGINFLVTNNGQMKDYLGYGKVKQPLLPMIGIPTTSGTGSEAQSYALISDAETHQKMACGDVSASFRVALLDPALTISQPRSITATSGFDAIAHAVETFVTTRRNGISDFFSREAWRLLESNYETVLAEPNNLEARGAMQLGAFFAGMAIENSMLGATHACANPLTAHYGTVHGAALAMLLPSVVRWNGSVVGDRYSELLKLSSQSGKLSDLKSEISDLKSEISDLKSEISENEQSAELLAQRLEQLAAEAGLQSTLANAGVPQSDLEMLAGEAAGQWTGTFNPRRFGYEGAMQIYERAY